MNENATGRVVTRACGCCRGEGGWCDECQGKCNPCEMSGMVEVWEPGGFDPSTLPGYDHTPTEPAIPGEVSVRTASYHPNMNGTERDLVIQWDVGGYLGYVPAFFILPLDILTADQVRAILTANRCPVEQSDPVG